MTENTASSRSFHTLRTTDLAAVTGGENIVHGHVGFRFEPTTRAEPPQPPLHRGRQR